MVTDGCARDLQEVRDLGLRVFAAGSVCSHGIPSLTNINQPVVISGVTVEPGDLIHGDENGVLKIPWECVDSLADKSREVLDHEWRLIQGMKSPGIPAGKIISIFCGDGVGEVDSEPG